MATGVIRALHLQAPPPPCYFPIMHHQLSPPPPGDQQRYPIMHQHSPAPPHEDQERETTERPEEGERQDEEEDDEEDDDDDDDECDAQEEDEALGPAPQSPPYSPDVTKQLLRFADIISRDVRRYFGRCPGDQDTCDIYNDSVSVTTGGRLRYYDDLLRLARAGSPPDDQRTAGGNGHAVAKGSNGLGPLAELFDQGGRSNGRGRPMSKRHLPLSFWTEPIPCCHLLALSSNPADAHSDAHTEQHYNTHTDTNTHYNTHTNTNTHCGDNTHPDFSDLLAHWDHNPEHTHTLTHNTH